MPEEGPSTPLEVFVAAIHDLDADTLVLVDDAEALLTPDPAS